MQVMHCRMVEKRELVRIYRERQRETACREFSFPLMSGKGFYKVEG
jgi:hypothetical protein